MNAITPVSSFQQNVVHHPPVLFRGGYFVLETTLTERNAELLTDQAFKKLQSATHRALYKEHRSGGICISGWVSEAYRLDRIEFDACEFASALWFQCGIEVDVVAGQFLIPIATRTCLHPHRA